MVACAIPRSSTLAVAWLGYALVAAWFVWPVLADPTHLALGHPANDVGNHIWGYAWVGAELSHGRLPDHTTLLAWPAGGSLWFIDAFNVLLTLPVNLAWGPVAAYNVGIFFNFWLAGVGAGALGERVSGSRLGGVVAGLAFLTTPQLLGQAYNGISETLAVGWLPLALVALDRLVERPTAGRGAAAGLAMAVATLFNWYYGLFGVIFALAFAARGALAARRGTGPRLRAFVGPAALAAVTFAALVAAPFHTFATTMSAEDALVTRDEAFVWKTLVLHNMTDLEALLHPGRFYSPDLHAVFGEDLIVVVYLGYALLVPAAVALVGRAGPARFWAALAGLFLLFSLGPFLYAGGDYVRVAGGWLPLPFLALFKWLPMFSRISHAYRFVVGVSLALSVLAALSVRVARQRAWDVPLYVGAVLVLRLVETTAFSSAVFPLPTTEVSPPAALARLDDGAVLDLPVGVPILARSRFLLEQLVHRRPVPYGLNEPTPKLLVHNHYTRYLLELERSTVALLPERRPFLDLELGRAALVDAGLRWIVVHRADYPPTQRRKVEAFLDQTATAVHEGDGLRIYRLDPTIAAVD